MKVIWGKIYMIRSENLVGTIIWCSTEDVVFSAEYD